MENIKGKMANASTKITMGSIKVYFILRSAREREIIFAHPFSPPSLKQKEGGERIPL
jgi:hypothetical protein